MDGAVLGAVASIVAGVAGAWLKGRQSQAIAQVGASAEWQQQMLSRIVALEHRNDALQTLNAAQESAIRRAEWEAEEQREEIREARAHVEGLEAVIAKRDAQIAALRKDRDATLRRCEALSRELHSLYQDLQGTRHEKKGDQNGPT